MAIGTPVSLGTRVDGASSTTVVLTLTAAVSLGNKVIVCVGRADVSAEALSSVTDSKGNSYTVAATVAPGSGSFAFYIAWSDITTALAISDTITATWASAHTKKTMSAASVSGLSAGGADKSSTGFNASASAPWSSGATAVTTSADEFVIGGSYCNDGVTTRTSTPDPGLTELEDFGDGTNHQAQTVVYKVVSVTGAQTASGNWSAGPQLGWAAAVVTFAAPPPVLFPRANVYRSMTVRH